MRKLALCAALLLFSSVHAADEPAGNIFHADLSNSDLSLAVRAFEQVCMPFILHQTELTQQNDIEHHQQMFEAQGYELVKSETRSNRVLIGRKMSSQETKQPTVSTSMETIISTNGEVNMFAHIQNPLIYKRLTKQVEIYKSQSDNRLTTRLDWGLNLLDPFGYRCQTKIEQPSFTQADFEVMFVVKDKDWTPVNTYWSQCVTDEALELRFNVIYDPKALSISVVKGPLISKRDKIYRENLKDNFVYRSICG